MLIFELKMKMNGFLVILKNLVNLGIRYYVNLLNLLILSSSARSKSLISLNAAILILLFMRMSISPTVTETILYDGLVFDTVVYESWVNVLCPKYGGV